MDYPYLPTAPIGLSVNTGNSITSYATERGSISALSSRDELRRDLLQTLGAEGFPEAPPLNLSVLWRRTFLEYEEWKIDYDVETMATMPAEAGWRVPAYLLIPRGPKEPMPAMICFHQCGIDCTVGKEAVVGKTPWAETKGVPTKDWTFLTTAGRVSIDRSDQAYGYELVHEGFVVLAPDSINCGERNVEGVRQPGENRKCWHIINPQLGRHESIFKRVIDARRAVDVLESLDFVDSQRIGAVGHSMGSGITFHLMAFDERVKAGILSGWGGEDAPFCPLIAPRLFMALCGNFDCKDPDQRAQNRQAFDYAVSCYEEANAPENILIRELDCGHRFADEFKWEAYRRLKEYFGILSLREPASLVAIVKEAQEQTRSWSEANRVVFTEVSGQECSVAADREQLVSAFAGLILYLTDRSMEVTLRVVVSSERGRNLVSFVCTGPPPIPREAPPSTFESLRRVRQVLAEHDAVLKWERSGSELICTAVFRSKGTPLEVL